MKKILSCLTVIIFVGAGSAFSQTPTDDVGARIAQLEAQLKLLAEELSKLKQSVTPAAETSGVRSPAIAAVDKSPQASGKTVGVDLPNGLKVIPYGTIYFNAFLNDAGTNNIDIPLFATPTGAGNSSASARQTRFGIRVDGGRFGDANVSGVIEADFFGGTPAVNIGENFGVVRLRLANARINWEKTSVVLGQDWIIFAPNNPVSIADAAIPQFAAAGNPWARLPQARVERRFDGGRFVVQGALLAPQTADSTSTAAFLLQPNSGALSRVPYLQTRAAFNAANMFGSGKNGSIGFSTHYGRSRASSTSGPIVSQEIDSYGFALDWNLPLQKRVVFTGETFYGSNLGGFQAGIFQNFNTDHAVRLGNSLTPDGVRGIGTRGGWAQLGITPKTAGDKLSFYGSIGLDDPEDEDLISAQPKNFRSRNLAIAFDAIYKMTQHLQIGIEFRRMETSYTQSGLKKAHHLNFGAAYSF